MKLVFSWVGVSFSSENKFLSILIFLEFLRNEAHGCIHLGPNDFLFSPLLNFFFAWPNFATFYVYFFPWFGLRAELQQKLLAGIPASVSLLLSPSRVAWTFVPSSILSTISPSCVRIRSYLYFPGGLIDHKKKIARGVFVCTILLFLLLTDTI